jgi:hypothetical protein
MVSPIEVTFLLAVVYDFVMLAVLKFNAFYIASMVLFKMSAVPLKVAFQAFCKSSEAFYVLLLGVAVTL